MTLSVPLESLKNTAINLECELSVVQAVRNGVERTIRRTERAAVMIALPKLLEHCVSVYSGVDLSGDDSVMDECVDFVMSQFAGISVPEVREAFKLAAAGKLGEIDLAAYYGKFTIKTLGKILTSYLVFREKAVKELRRAEAEAAEQVAAEKAAREPFGAEKMAGWVEERIAKFWATEKIDLFMIPIPVYDYLVELNVITLTPTEKRDLMNRVAPQVVGSYTMDIKESNNEFEKRKYRNIISDWRSGKKPIEFVNRQKVAARQLAVQEFILGYRSAIAFLLSLLKQVPNADAA